MATAPDEGRADALQHRCAQLEEENARLSSKLLRARRLIARVEKEKSFVLGRLLQYEGWQASDSGTDTNSSGEEEEEDHDEGIEMSDDGSDSEQSSESEPPAKKAKRGLKRDRLPSPRDDAFAGESDGGLCVAVVKKRPCKSKALAGFKYCWHHAPLDPNSPFTWCQFVRDVHGCPQWLLSPNLFEDEAGDVSDHAVTPGVAASDLRRLESISTKPTVKQCPWCKNAPGSFSGLVHHAASEFHTDCVWNAHRLRA